MPWRNERVNRHGHPTRSSRRTGTRHDDESDTDSEDHAADDSDGDTAPTATVALARRLCANGNEQACKTLERLCESGNDAACKVI